jgi:hypothetical protein
MDALAVLRLPCLSADEGREDVRYQCRSLDGSLSVDPAVINRIGIEFFFEELGAAHRPGGDPSGSFGSKKYAREEIVALSGQSDRILSGQLAAACEFFPLLPQ